MKRVAVLYNDDGPLLTKGAEEDRVAWDGGMRAARLVAESLIRSGFAADELPCGSSLPSLVDRLEERKPDLVFNLCESYGGESRLEAAMAGV